MKKLKSLNIPKTILRYTNLPALLQILQSKTITLLNPASWNDRNDSFLMSQYKLHIHAKSVLALCFTQADQTYHHWNVFAGGSTGVCIDFDRLMLMKNLGGVQRGCVKYKTIKELHDFRPQESQMPFLKRYAYRDEKEYRLVFVDPNHEIEAMHFDIDLTSIRRITLSPWLQKELVPAVKEAIHSFPGCKELKIHHSTILENERWKSFAKRGGNTQ